jgi:hypothetical protein
MLILQSTDALTMILSAAVTANNWHYSAYGVDKPSDALYSNKGTDLTNAAKTLVAAPSADSRCVTEFIIKNKDTAIGIVTVYVDSSTDVDLGSWSLAPGQSLFYSKEAGFAVIPSTSALVGITDASNAAAGIVGEYLTATVSNQNFPTSGQWGNNITLNLTPGDWDLSAMLSCQYNGATVTIVGVFFGTVTGNDATGISAGDSGTFILPPTSAASNGVGIPNYRVVTPAAKAYYLKVYATYSVATPQYSARASARRVR